MRKLLATAALVAASTVAAEPQVLRGWLYEKEVDGFTDQSKHFATVLLKEGTEVYAIGVRCVDGDFGVLVSLDEYLVSESPVRVMFRIDEGEVQHESWLISASNDAAFASDPVAFARQIMQGASILFRAYDYRDIAHTVRFPLNGSAAAIKPVMDACGVS